jgi:hypothetical protein
MAHGMPLTRTSGKVSYIASWRNNGSFRQRTFSVKREAERFADNVESDLTEGTSTAPLIKHSKTFRQVAETSLAASEAQLMPRTYDGLVVVPSNVF